MWIRCSAVAIFSSFAILVFYAACTPATPEGTPYSSNMTGLDGVLSPEETPTAATGETPPTDEPKPNEPKPDAAPQVDTAQTAETKDAMPAANPDEQTTTPTTTAATKPSKALAPDKTLPRKPGVQDLTFDDIAFEMEKGEPFTRSMLPERIEELGNQKIRIRGYILPSFESRGIKQFVLVRDNMECCFGPGAALYDCILVEMTGPGVDFTVRPITVEGVFEVKEYKGGDGKHLAIYRMDGESAK
ncbi:DUF3299 domain-containing protein [Blastopirellula marina]|uniref:DUF3299 domain-containing protein n=1 Tax=Blastopirellula marina DSM 3645 TaxID=314230 RepID=A3ZN51_9BACT|nr:DUF3299 domain-containing protein [Blastopirellula marina]EAQ82380.1 hypothetical protein DSM3645_01660 [Blastopirellula marina DSM 3645]